MPYQYKSFIICFISLLYTLLIFLLLESDTIIFGDNNTDQLVESKDAVSLQFVGLQDLGDE